MDTILSLRHVSKNFNLDSGFFAKQDKKVYAVNDLSFEIKRGQTYGLVGESGCGKSTTAKMIVGMYPVTQGNIIYKNSTGTETDISHLRKKDLKLYREKVKYIFQDPSRSLNPRMNVFNILNCAYKYSSCYPGKIEARKEAEKIIEMTGLDKKDLERYPSEFSGGQRQRISIARALIMKPDFIVCDEVVSALDVSIQGQILNLLDDLRKKLNLTIIFIAHDLKITQWFCDKIAVMYRGMIVEENDAKDFSKNALHPYSKLLFNEDDFKNQNNGEVKSVLEKENSCPFAHRCPLCQKKCLEELPLLTERNSGHKVRCFFC